MTLTEMRLVAIASLLLGCTGPKNTAALPPKPAPAAAQLAVAAPSKPQTAHDQANVPVASDDLVVGRWDANVTMVAFLDLECPFCNRVSGTMQQLREKFGTDLRLVIKHNPLPFHAHAYDAALALATVRGLAGNDAGYRFMLKALEGQRDLSPIALSHWAEECGVAKVVYDEAMSSHRFAHKVDADIELAKQIGASGTPAFRINGVSITGSQALEAFADVIEKQNQEAKGLLAAGTASGNLYVALTEKNFALPEAVPDTTPPEDLSVWKLPVASDDPVLGPTDAPVTIIVFSDFECPYCARVEKTLKSVRDKYGDLVRFVWKDNPLPFHKQALPAATLGRLVYQQQGNQAFWALHDTLFSNQETLEQTISAEAAKLHVSAHQLAQAQERGKALDKVEASQALAFEFEAHGTPHFFVNGVRLSGAKPLEAFVERIDASLVQTKALKDQGVAGKQLYSSVIASGKEPLPPEQRAVPLPKTNRPSRGAAQAPVTLQIFSDFQCPFCKRMPPILDRLEREFPGKLRIVWRHMPLPFHDHAELAAEAAEAAYAQKGNPGFWAFHDKLFEAQDQAGGLSRESLEAIATSISLDLPKFKKALDEGTYKAAVAADLEVSQNAEIQGTPAASINSYFISGAQPLAAFRRAVRRALSEAKSLPHR